METLKNWSSESLKKSLRPRDKIAPESHYRRENRGMHLGKQLEYEVSNRSVPSEPSSIAALMTFVENCKDPVFETF
jgi:hypothetical protein